MISSDGTKEKHPKSTWTVMQIRKCMKMLHDRSGIAVMNHQGYTASKRSVENLHSRMMSGTQHLGPNLEHPQLTRLAINALKLIG